MTQPVTIRLFVPINRMQATVRFYTEAFGFSVKTDAMDDRSTCLTLGDQEIYLITLPGKLARQQTGLSFRVHNLRGCLNHLVSEGYLPQSYLEKAARPTRRLEIQDPGGNIVTLVDANQVNH